MIKFGEWHPIETAPKNRHAEGYEHESYIIGTDGKSVEPIHWYGNILDGHYSKNRSDGYWVWPDDGIERNDPTHWMPLPTPPIIKDQLNDE